MFSLTPLGVPHTLKGEKVPFTPLEKNRLYPPPHWVEYTLLHYKGTQSHKVGYTLLYGGGTLPHRVGYTLLHGGGTLPHRVGYTLLHGGGTLPHGVGYTLLIGGGTLPHGVGYTILHHWGTLPHGGTPYTMVGVFYHMGWGILKPIGARKSGTRRTFYTTVE